MSTSILMDQAQKAREDAARKAAKEAEEAKNQNDNLEASLRDDTNNPKIPEKFRGKTREEIAESYVNLEKERGRLANELNQVRQTVDQLANLERTGNKKEEQDPITPDDLFQDPEKAIAQTIERNPAIQTLSSKAEQIERSIQLNEFSRRHPTYQEDLANPEFRDWITSSPVRTRLATAADGYDFQAADDLWNLWKEHKQLREQAAAMNRAAQEEDRRRKELEGTLEGGSGNSTEEKKVFSRSEIIDLKKRALQGDPKARAIVEDPTWRAEVNRAYLEKRVQ